MIFEHDNYRSYLHANLVEKISRNPSYSLRAMAKQLGLSPSTLSEVIKGKRNLSYERGSSLGLKLGLTGKEQEYFSLLVQVENTKDMEMKEALQTQLEVINPNRKVQNLSMDLFRTIADWHHTAILYLSEIQGFSFTPREIAKKLSISPFEAEEAVDRLLRLELLKKTKDGKYEQPPAFLFESTVHNESLRKFHRQTLEKAIQSLQTQTPKEKIVRTETFAIDASLLPKADDLTEEYVAKMKKLFSKSKKKNEVYHLGIQLFNLLK